MHGVCGLVMITPIGSNLGCQKQIYLPIMLKFDIWIPSYLVNIINHMLVCQWVWFDDSYTHRKLFWLPKANYNQAKIWHVVSK